MAMKRMTISFDIDAEVFGAMLVRGNRAMRIDVHGDEPREPKAPNKALTSGRGQKLLTGPTKTKKAGNKVASPNQDFLRELFLAKRTLTKRELRERWKEKGLNMPSLAGTIHALEKKGLIDRVGRGTYHKTPAHP